MSDILQGASSIDTNVPSVAWIYDYRLGGNDHFAPDRIAALRVAPDATSRSRDEILQLFAGYEPVDPGLVQLPYWRRTNHSAQTRKNAGLSAASATSRA